MASKQPFINDSGNRQNITFPASSIELSDGTTAQAAVESLQQSAQESSAFKTSIESKYRKANTAYAKDSMSYATELPAGFYLECSTAGTTSTGALTLPATIADGTTFSDGTVSWTIRKAVNTSNIPSLNGYATTNYVDNKVSDYATTSYVDSKVPSLSGYAKLASPTFTGTPKAPTPSTSTNSTQIATTAFVQSLVASSGGSSGDFTIIYPNGSASSPATTAKKTVVIATNPFPGYHIQCDLEVQYNSQWGRLGHNHVDGNGSDSNTNGGFAVQGGTAGDDIYIEFGNNAILTRSRMEGNPFNVTSTVTTMLPYRVKVWKIGKK